jgi:hypothetical protein
MAHDGSMACGHAFLEQLNETTGFTISVIFYPGTANLGTRGAKVVGPSFAPFQLGVTSGYSKTHTEWRLAFLGKCA